MIGGTKGCGCEDCCCCWCCCSETGAGGGGRGCGSSDSALSVSALSTSSMVRLRADLPAAAGFLRPAVLFLGAWYQLSSRGRGFDARPVSERVSGRRGGTEVFSIAATLPLEDAVAVSWDGGG